MQINLILNFIWNSICSVKNIIHQVLGTFYLRINKLPILFSLAIIVVSAGLVFMVGLFIFFIVLYPGFIGTPLLFIEAPSLFLLAAACAGSWVGLFRFSWIASTLLYNPDNLLMTYLGTLYFYAVHYPQLVIFNFLLVSYNVYFFKYLKDLVYARLTGAERLNLSKDTKETLVGFIVVGILIIIIVCPPALGIGLSTSMDPYFESCSTYEQVHPSIALLICVGIVFSIAVLIKSIDLVILHKHEAGSLRQSVAFSFCPQRKSKGSQKSVKKKINLFFAICVSFLILATLYLFVFHSQEIINMLNSAGLIAKTIFHRIFFYFKNNLLVSKMTPNPPHRNSSKTWAQFFGFGSTVNDPYEVAPASTASRVLNEVHKTERDIEHTCQGIDMRLMQSMMQGKSQDEINKLFEKKELCLELQKRVKHLAYKQADIFAKDTINKNPYTTLNESFNYHMGSMASKVAEPYARAAADGAVKNAAYYATKKV